MRSIDSEGGARAICCDECRITSITLRCHAAPSGIEACRKAPACRRWPRLSRRFDIFIYQKMLRIFSLLPLFDLPVCLSASLFDDVHSRRSVLMPTRPSLPPRQHERALISAQVERDSHRRHRVLLVSMMPLRHRRAFIAASKSSCLYRRHRLLLSAVTT